jgi:hypothetical protein
MFHAWGVPYAKTAHPAVVIGSSNSNNIVGMEGEEGERRSRRRKTSPMGQCYPLSMSTANDGMDDLLIPTFATTHHQHGEMNNNDEDDDDANMLGSSYGRPRYTIDLPYPIYIDAVTLEHRSFPINQQQHGDDNVGGESAPRYVRVVGYPPCPGLDDNWINKEGSGYGSSSSSSSSGIAQSCELSQYGFDVSSPINLGLLEYQRVTPVNDEKNVRRYKAKTTTNTNKNEELLSSSFLEGGRYRSTQTFAVKGGLWKPRLLEEDVFSSFTINDDIATQVKNKEKEKLVEIMLEVDDDNDDNPEFVSPGQCTPPKDEDSVPSCGENVNDTSDMKETGRSSGSHRRRIVKAVSFIVEENWGNADYTCLYRVRVHGDKVV